MADYETSVRVYSQLFFINQFDEVAGNETAGENKSADHAFWKQKKLC